MRLAVFALILASATCAGLAKGAAAIGEPPKDRHESCVLISQKVVDLNRQCTYRCPSGEAVQTVRLTQTCPLTWDR